MPFKVLQAQPTPNPNAIKFILDHPISDRPTSFFTPDSAAGHPIASQLFAIPGVTSVLLLGDFVTVNKRSELPWASIKSKVRSILKMA